MYEKTTETTVWTEAAIWAIPRNEHQISKSEDGCPFYYMLKAGYHEPYQDGAIKLHTLELSAELPGGIPLLEKAIETLKDQIEDEQRKSTKRVADMQARIDALALIEYVPEQEAYQEPMEPDDSMDGDFDSAMASAGHGTDEDYGGGDERL